MALPREMTAGEDGNLIIGPVKTVIADVFSALPLFDFPKIELKAVVGGTATKFLDKVNCKRPYIISFNIRSASAASLGLIFDVGVDLKGCYLRIVSTRPGDLKSPGSCHELATRLLGKTLCPWGSFE
jgi:beta-fructofuranosidase